MAWDAHKNLAISRIVTPPSPAASGTTFTVDSGDGALFPTPPFNVTVWPQGQSPSPDNAEILRVTTIVGDDFTATRAQEGTAAIAIGNNYQIANTITSKVIEDIETAISNIISAGGGGVSVISAELASVDARVTSVNAHDDVLSASIAVVSAAAAAADVHASVASIAATSADNHANTVSIAAAAADAHASTASLAATSIGAILASVSAVSGATSVKGLQSVINQLSNRISSLTGGGTTTAFVSALVDTASNTASAGNASLDVKISVVSDRITSISAQLTSLEVHASAASAAASVADAKASVISDRITSISAQLTSLEVHASAASAAASAADVHASTASLAATSVNSRVTSLEAALGSISARTTAAVSVNGLQSAVNALSAKISAAVAGTAYGFLLSMQNVDAAAVSAGVPVYAFTSANTFKKADASATGTELVLGLVADASIAISGVGRVQTDGKITLTSVQWGDVTSATTSGLVTGALYYLAPSAGMLTSIAPTGSAVVHVVGQALSPTEMQLMLTPFDDATSAFSAIEATISNLNSAHNVLSNRVSANSGTGGGGADSAYVLSQINLLSVQVTSINAFLSNAISAGCATASVLQTSINVISNQLSAVSGGGVNGLQSVVNALSATIAAGGATTLYVSTAIDTASNLASAANVSLSTVVKADIASVSAAIKADITSVSAVIKADIASVSGVLAASIRQLSLDLDAKTSVLSDKVVSISAQLTSVNAAITSIDAKASVISDRVVSISAQFTSINNKLASVSAASGAGSINGLQSVINNLSSRIAAGGATTAFVSALVDTASNTASAGNASLDGRIASVSAVFASLSVRDSAAASIHGLQSIINVLSAGDAAIISGINALDGRVVSNESRLSTLSDKVVSISAQLTSVETHINTVSAAVAGGGVTTAYISAISARNDVSALTSVRGFQSVIDGLSQRISINHKFISDAISAGSATASNLLSNINAMSTMIASVSAASGAGSAKGLQSVVNALSAHINTVSNADSVTRSAYANASTVGSIAALSFAIANDASVSAAIIQNLSLQQGAGQFHVVTGAQALSTGTFTKLSGLSLSLGGSNIYKVEGQVNYAPNATSGTAVFQFGMSATQQPVYAAFRFQGPSAAGTGAAVNSNIMFGGESAISGTPSVMYSIKPGVSGNGHMMFFDGIIQCSTAAGVLKCVFAATTTNNGGCTIRVGSYIRAYRIG